MEELLIANNEASFGLLFTISGTFVAIISGFGSLLVIKPCFARKLLLIALILVTMANVFLVGLGINLRLAKAAADKQRSPLVAPESRPSPLPFPKEKEIKPEITDEMAAAGGVDFVLSSRPNASIRREYCIDSEFSGKFYKYSGNLMVKLDNAELDLCKYSSDNQREIEFRIGIGRHDDIAKQNWKAIAWATKPQRAKITAGSQAQLAADQSIPITMNRILRNTSSENLASLGVVISVYNRDRKGRYYLTK